MKKKDILLKKILALNYNKKIKLKKLNKKLSHKNQKKIIKDLLFEGLIHKKRIKNNELIKVTEKGLKKVRTNFYKEKNNKEEEIDFICFGEIKNGLSIGKDFVKKEKYQIQFQNKLGFKAFPGTLNVELIDESIKKIDKIKERKGIKISGFNTNDGKLGTATCFPSLINGYESALVFPEKTNHGKEIVELISPYKLREKIDGKEVMIEVKNEL